jgi:hypothetical protein
MLDVDYTWKNIETCLKQMTLHSQQIFVQQPGKNKIEVRKQKQKNDRGLGI